MVISSGLLATKSSLGFQFALLLAISGVLWWHSIADVARLALNDEAYTHILLILPLTGALFYLDSKSSRFAVSPSAELGSACLATALLIAGFIRWVPLGSDVDNRLFLSVIGLVIWWIGSFIFCFGKRIATSLLFPLCFLFWIVPLPAMALDEVVYFLQHESALAARLMFMAVGVPVSQDGIMLSIPNLDIEVARECSSIRSSMLLLIVTVVLAHLFLRSRWRKAALIAAAIPVAAIKNGFRIFTITELGTRVDPGFFDGNLHHRGGVVFFGLALVMMVALLWGLRRTETVLAPVQDS